MSDVSNSTIAELLEQRAQNSVSRFAVEEAQWGYIIRPNDGRHSSLQMLQSVALIIGASFAAASIGLLVLPDFLTGSSDFLLRSGAAVVFAGLAAFLLWFASRGTEVEFHIDKRRGEIREMVINRAGRSNRLGSYRFDAIGHVYINRSDTNPRNAALVMRFGNSAQTAVVANGTPMQLEALKDRLGRDLIIGKASPV